MLIEFQKPQQFIIFLTYKVDNMETNINGLQTFFINCEDLLSLCLFTFVFRGQGGAVVIHLRPTTDISGSNLGPYVRKLVVPYRWSAFYSTEP